MRRGRMGFWYRLAVIVVKPVLLVLTRREWSGQENIPSSGGVIVVANHISYADPLVLAHYLYDAGRLPRYLTKIEVFRARFVGRVARGAEQIPVHRYTGDASQALSAAVDAVRRGECVVIYPEGTVTKDPAWWPMRARTGVARLALATDAPVIPVGQWGAQELFGRDMKLHPWPRKTVRLTAGAPVDLAQFRGREPTAETLRACTERVMSDVRALVGGLRGGSPPQAVFDPREAGAVPAGERGERRPA